MKIIKEAIAGSLESSDCLIMVKPSEKLEYEVESIVQKRYGGQIRAVIEDALKEMGVTAGYYFIQDKGAVDYCLRARITTVTRRGCEKQ